MLATPRQINAAIEESKRSGKNVYCVPAGEHEARRIYAARTYKKRLQVRLLSSGEWVNPEKVYEE